MHEPQSSSVVKKRTRTPKSTRKVIINLNSMDNDANHFSNILTGENGPSENIKIGESMNSKNKDIEFEPAHYRYANND